MITLRSSLGMSDLKLNLSQLNARPIISKYVTTNSEIQFLLKHQRALFYHKAIPQLLRQTTLSSYGDVWLSL